MPMVEIKEIGSNRHQLFANSDEVLIGPKPADESADQELLCTKLLRARHRAKEDQALGILVKADLEDQAVQSTASRA